VPDEGARLLTRVRSAAEQGQTAPAPPRACERLVAMRPQLLACASINRSGGIDSDWLHGPPAEHWACPRTVLRTAVDNSVD
jgi:hypothetical protein